jgi:hypothetical protein
MKTRYKVLLAILALPAIGAVFQQPKSQNAQAEAQPQADPAPKPPASENHMDTNGQLTAEDFDAIEFAHRAIKERLRDPDSAIFDDQQSWMDHRVVIVHRQYGQPIFVCGRVNAKNGYGGYTGDQQYVVSVKSGAVQLDATNRDVDAVCG